MNDDVAKPLSEINEFTQRAIKKVKINRSIKTVVGNENNPDSDIILNESTEYGVATQGRRPEGNFRADGLLPGQEDESQSRGYYLAERRDKFIEWLQGGDPAKVIDQKPVSVITAAGETVIGDPVNNFRSIKGKQWKVIENALILRS